MKADFAGGGAEDVGRGRASEEAVLDKGGNGVGVRAQLLDEARVGGETDRDVGEEDDGAAASGHEEDQQDLDAFVVGEVVALLRRWLRMLASGLSVRPTDRSLKYSVNSLVNSR